MCYVVGNVEYGEDREAGYSAKKNKIRWRNFLVLKNIFAVYYPVNPKIGTIFKNYSCH